MTNHEKLRDVPHFEAIVENGYTTIPSIFMFDNNNDLYPFLYACRKCNCTVYFENENLTIEPERDVAGDVKIMAYSMMMSCREIGDAYIRYLGNLAKMKWVQGEHEPILK